MSDYQGNEIILDSPAQRIIGLAPHVVENIYSAGAGDKVVGVVGYSNFPEAAQVKPIVGDYNTTNFELITELDPDLIVAWNSGHRMDVVNKLKELGFTVYIDDPHRLEDVARSIRDIGSLSGTSSIATKVASSYLKRLEELRNVYADELAVYVLYQVWMDPLQTLNGEHIISDVIRTCGGHNIFSDAPTLAPKINIESVISRNPQVILAGGMATEKPEWLRAWRQWPAIHAVKKQQVYAIPPDIISRHTVRILEGAELVCNRLQEVREKITQ